MFAAAAPLARDLGPLPIGVWFFIASFLILLVTIALGLAAGGRGTRATTRRARPTRS